MTTLSRRSFLRGAVALGAGVFLYRLPGGFRIVNAAAGPETRQLRLVHTNDHHSRIEPVRDLTVGRVSGVSQTRNLGGVARRKTLFDQIRAETTWTTFPAYDQDVLFLDAGDVFQGTLYFNVYEGEADQWFYNRLGYNAQAIGNHEFDKGDQLLADFVAAATYPIVAANMTVASPSPLAALYVEEVPAPSAPGAVVGQWGKRTIVTLPSGEKVGIFGLTTVETKNIASPSAQVTFDPEYATVANAQAAALRAAGCKTVIALTHIGYSADIALAPQLVGVNIIVGGHSHTPMLPSTPDPKPFGGSSQANYPQVLTGADGEQIVVVQDWEWGKWVGDLVVGFDDDGRVSSIVGKTIRPVWADRLLPTKSDGSPRDLLPGEGAEIAADPAFQTQITDVYKGAITALEQQKVGTAPVALSNRDVRAAETPLGNLIADAVRAGVLAFADNDPAIPVVAIVNGGGIRRDIPAGDVTVALLLEVQPFGNTLGRVDVTGAQLKAALENGVSALQPGAALDSSRNAVGSGRFPNVAGLRYVINPQAPSAQPALAATSTQPAVPARPGQRISAVEVLERQSDGTEKYVPLSLTKTYRVASFNFVINGGDGYSVFTPAGDLADPAVGAGVNQITSGPTDAQATIDYVSALPNATINTTVEGRISFNYAIFLPQLTTIRATAPALAEVAD